MALPLKTGADLYNQQLIRARLQNLGAQPNTADVGLGQVYFNTGTNTAASLRIGYCYETGSVPKFHHVANLEDINRLDELISALSGSSSESVASVLGRVVTLEGYFSNGKAKDADLLDGHNSDYFATATTVNDLLEDYEAFKAVFSDNSDDYINTWTEVKDFLDGIKNTEDLNAILLGINTELGKKADKATTLAGYGITDGMKVMPWIASDGVDFNNLTTVGSYGIASQNALNGPIWYGTLLTMGGDYNYYRSQLAIFENGQMYVRAKNGNDIWSDWRTVLDNYNYASELDKRYLQLTGGIISNTSNAPLKIKTDSESAWVGIEYLNNLGEREGSIGVYGGEPIFVPATLDKIWTILHGGNYSDLITDLNNNLNVPSITIGGIKLSAVEGQLQIEGDAFATGQLSSGGIGSEGSGSGASGIVILEDWEKYDDTLAQVLGAGLGVGLRDKIAALESKATNVSVAQTLTSGKEIGAITIDGVATKLFAPSTYAWDEITSKPTTLSGYGITDAVALQGKRNNLLHGGNEFGFVSEGFSGEVWFNYRTLNAADGNITLYNFGAGCGFNFSKLCSSGYVVYGGNSSQFLKADGSLDSNAYLPLSGGTITGKLTTKSYVWFNQYDEDAEYGLGMTHAGGNLCWYNGSAWNDILHSGNFNTFAPTLTGTGASGTWGIDISGSAAKLGGYSAGDYFRNLRFTIDNAEKLDAIDKSFNGVMQTSNYSPIDGIYSYGQLIQFADITGTTQIYIADWNNGIYVRNSWLAQTKGFEHDWKQLAYTTSNVASATKLQTARSLWGNSFDGTADINGDIHLAAGKGIVASNGYTVLTAPSYLLLGYAQSELGQTTYLDGNDIYLRYGKNHVPAMYINSSGNVTIGASDLALTNHKLYVQGNAHIERELFGANTTDSSILGWRLFANADATYLQAGKVTGAQNGNLYLTGLYGATLSRFIVYSDTSEMTGRLLVGGAADDGTTALQVHGDIALKRGVSSAIGAPYDTNNPTIYNRIIFDGATYGIRYYSGGWTSSVVDSHTFYVGLNNDAALVIKNNKDVHISGNLVVDGEVSAGGVATEGTGGATGGSGLDRLVFKIPANTTSFPCEHGLGTRDISVSIYENGNDFQQVLADVYLDSTNVARIVFGSATDVEHKVVIIG